MPQTMEIPGHDGPVRVVLPRPFCRLPGNRRGYYQRGNGRDFGCMWAAVATVTQRPDLPGRMGNLGDLLTWAEPNGWMVDVHEEKAPVDLPVWIAETPPLAERGGLKLSHMLVMAYDQIVFDPGAGWVLPNGDALHGQDFEIRRGYELTRLGAN